jgi:two-component system, OmpR family, flagellar system response regulator FtcR
MIVIVDERPLVLEGYGSLFEREGIACSGFRSAEFADWVASAADEDLRSVRAVLIGETRGEAVTPSKVRERTGAPVLALIEQSNLENTLRLFEAGVDDVIRKPVHIREILARVTAIRRRAESENKGAEVGAMRIFADGRDPEVDGAPLALPRRERRILEYLAANNGRRVTKTQVFNAIYGIFDDEVEENVVESHISKLRKKLRERLGYDPIDSKRFLGYRLALAA